MKYVCRLHQILLLALVVVGGAKAFVVKSAFIAKPVYHAHLSAETQLSMGLLDSLSSFLQDREGDFVKLEDTEIYGPGPLLVLYNVPNGIEVEEVQDMLADGAPKAFQQGVTICRVSSSDDGLLDMSMSDALEKAAKGVESSSAAAFEEGICPVLLFSGIRNDEMMATYNIVGKEIYEESGGTLTPACAKAVLNAMAKPLRQVLDEISGDHEDALSADETDKE